ncbi:MAG: BMP family ABC transporter substrate-binding protein [Lachnospiraceae bacterium]|jgi:basic membrane protein A|nr:BMP family ABC transporter substrate-binding protein [Lachnospiraceae bacterium]MCI9395502.1 BMP family ABC transporter substrate-binding protein [Lachnospiraceae bacterium]
MRKRKLGLAGLILLLILTGCGNPAQETVSSAENDEPEETKQESEGEEENGSGVETTTWREAVQKMFEDPYGDYSETGGEIAFLTDGSVEDGGYNEAVFNGVRMYALGAGTSFSYYHADPNVPESYGEMIQRAVADNAGLVVCAGDLFGKAVGALQETYPQTSFLLVDTVPHDEEGEELSLAQNVHCILFHEEQAGYLAGYMAVWEGYRNLGFIGGREEPAVLRYGYGYLQGIDAAAKDLSLDDVTVNYWYADTYAADIAVRERADGWYENGTQIIFACGGGLYESVLEAAENRDGLMIGADVDQCRISDRVLTSAVKNIGPAVTDALDEYYAAGGWSEEDAGQVRRYGVQDGCAAIPVVDTEWRFKEIPTTHFFEIYKQMKRGDRGVSDAIEAPPQVAVAVNFE